MPFLFVFCCCLFSIIPTIFPSFSDQGEALRPKSICLDSCEKYPSYVNIFWKTIWLLLFSYLRRAHLLFFVLLPFTKYWSFGERQLHTSALIIDQIQPPQAWFYFMNIREARDIFCFIFLLTVHHLAFISHSGVSPSLFSRYFYLYFYTNLRNWASFEVCIKVCMLVALSCWHPFAPKDQSQKSALLFNRRTRVLTISCRRLFFWGDYRAGAY